jgi:uncharacterized membrane protein (UPF0182 family)
MSTNNVMNLTPEQVERVKTLLNSMRDGTTFAEACERIFDQGLYQLEYRYGSEATSARKAYAKRRQAEQKVANELYKRAQKDPDLAVRLGLGKRVEL